MPDDERTKQNREYLAEIAAEGDYSPKKPIAEMTADYVNRIAGEFHKQERAGLPFELAPARGHGRTEHGREVERDYNPAAYEAARTLADVEGVEIDTQGRIYVDTASFDFDNLADLADFAPSSKLTLHTEYGDLFSHGITPEQLEKLIEREYAGDYDDMIEDQAVKQGYKDRS